MAVKIIYAQARKPGTDRTLFRGQWREHGGIAMQQPDFFGTVLRYVQSDVVATVTTERNVERSYDGVGEIVYPLLHDLNTAFDSKGSKEIVGPHGASIFGSPNPMRMIAEEHVEWLDRPGCAKVYSWVRKPAEMSREAFLELWAAKSGDWAKETPLRASVCGYTRSVSLDADGAFDAVEEVTFVSLEGARRSSLIRDGLVSSLGPEHTVTMLGWQVVLLNTTQVAS